MTKAEHEKLIRDIEQRASLEVDQVRMQFALQNNTVEIGRIITDFTNTIRVESIRVHIGYKGVPMLRYTGERLTKSGKAYKSLEKATIYQCNMCDDR